MRGLSKFLWACVLLSTVPGEVAAQYRMRVPGQGTFSSMRQHFSDRAVRRSTTPDQNGRPGAPAPSSNASTAFRPTAAELAPAIMAGPVPTKSDSTAQRADTKKGYSELLAMFRERLRTAGGPQNDVARAAAWMTVNSYQIYFGRPPLSQAQFDSVYSQLRSEFAASGQFRAKADRERQVEFELYGILGTAVLPVAGVEQKTVRALARENLRGFFGAVPEQISLTPEGFVVRAEGPR